MATRSKKDPELADEAPQNETPEAETEGTPPDAVLIVVERQSDGSIRTDAQPIGDVRVAEVDTILELGRAGWRSKIGLGKA